MKPTGIVQEKTIEISSDNPLDQLQELYDYALHLLNTNQTLDAIDLLKGLINECNQHVKKFYLGTQEECILVPRFYLIYGNSLRKYATLEIKDGEELVKYLIAARDQFELGLEKEQDGFKNDILVELLLLNLFQDEIIKNQKLMSSTREIISSIKSLKLRNDQTLRLGLYIQEYADQLNQLNDRMEWNNIALSFLRDLEEKIDENDTLYLSIVDGICDCYLSMANFYAEQGNIRDSESDECVSFCSDIESAKSVLGLALEWVDKALKQSNYAPCLAKKGEILIYMADISADLQNAQESEDFYQKAIEALKECHSIDSKILPDSFLELIRGIES